MPNFLEFRNELYMLVVITELCRIKHFWNDIEKYEIDLLNSSI